jgi:hypothetical protein
MLRYLVAASVALVAALLLVGVVRNPSLRSDDVEVPSDELLAYDLAATPGVKIGLMQQTSEIRLTAWCVVEHARPEERFDFCVRVEWLDTAGNVLSESPVAFESRVSQLTPSKSPSSFAARLAYSDALVTDSRTVRLLVPEFSGRHPSQMRLSPNAASLQRILVRTTFPEARQAFEVAAVDRRLRPFERLEIIHDRASVGYDDLPFSLRAVALATWQRRLDASGIEGKDYRVERLLVGSGRTGAGLANAQRHEWLIHRRHALALNAHGRVPIEIHAPAHTLLQVAAGVDQEPRSVTVDEKGRASLEVGQPTHMQTVVVSSTSDAPVPVSISVAANQLDAFLGPTQPLEGSERLVVAPLLRRSGYYQLDPQGPVLLKVAPGQKFVGLQVRSTHASLHGNIEAQIDKDRAAIDVDMMPTVFEQWQDEVPATDAQQLFVRLPAGARQIALRGSPHLRVAPFTVDPDIMSDRLAPEYEVPLPADMRWKFPRYDIDRQVSLRPENELELGAAGRKLELVAQSRLVARGRTGEEPETTLVPTTTAAQRHVVEPVRWSPDIPLPEDVVIALDHPHRGYVTSKGPRAGRVRVAYRLGEAAVGEAFELLVDQAALHNEEAVASSGQFEIPVAPGTHTFELKGLKGDSEVLLEATPLEASGALRRKVAYRIAPGAVLRFVVDKQADIANVVIFTYLQNERLVSMRYAVEGSKVSDFLHSVTALHGEIAGVATEARGVWYWESGPKKSLNQHRSVLTLGNDLAKGKLALVLRNQSRFAVFVALVLVGQAANDRPKVQRFWTTEEP